MDDEEALINAVKDHRELYDPEYKLYQDYARREAAWQEISKRIRIPVHECRDKWKRLRDNFRKAKKLREMKKRQGFKKMRTIKHESIMGFVQPCREVKRGEKADSLADRDEDCESTGSSSHLVKDTQEYEPSQETYTDPLVDLDNRRHYAEESQKPDTVVTFFTNLGETVKNFPEDIQIRVKRDIFKIVNEAEEEVCRRNNDSNVLMKFEISGI